MIRIGEMLVSLSACPQEAVDEALQNQVFFGARLGTNLIEMGAVDEMQLAAALGRLYRAPVVAGNVSVDPRAVALVPRQLVEAHDVMPYTVADRTLRVLVADPRDVRAIDELAFATGKRVEALVAPEARLWSLIRQHYGIPRGMRGIDGDQRRRWAPRLFPVRGGFVQPLAADVWTAGEAPAPPEPESAPPIAVPNRRRNGTR